MEFARVHRVNASVDVERLAVPPGFLNNACMADIEHLLYDIELNEPVTSLDRIFDFL